MKEARGKQFTLPSQSALVEEARTAAARCPRALVQSPPRSATANRPLPPRPFADALQAHTNTYMYIYIEIEV